MAPNLTSGAFKVLSLIDGNPPVGVNFTYPGFQFVYLNGPVTEWVVEKEGGNNYRFGLGGYPFTGVFEKRVTASNLPELNTEWIATYREDQDAYTISPINDDIRGWTVANMEGPNAQIFLWGIVSPRSYPRQRFLPSQLFRFEAIDE